MSAAEFRVGDRVRIERDETRWPSQGSWPQYRGRVGTIVKINPGVGEYGVVFGPKRRASLLTPSGKPQGYHRVSWFLSHELVALEAASRKTGGAGDAA